LDIPLTISFEQHVVFGFIPSPVLELPCSFYYEQQVITSTLVLDNPVCIVFDGLDSDCIASLESGSLHNGDSIGNSDNNNILLDFNNLFMDPQAPPLDLYWQDRFKKFLHEKFFQAFEGGEDGDMDNRDGDMDGEEDKDKDDNKDDVDDNEEDKDKDDVDDNKDDTDDDEDNGDKDKDNVDKVDINDKQVSLLHHNMVDYISVDDLSQVSQHMVCDIDLWQMTLVVISLDYVCKANSSDLSGKFSQLGLTLLTLDVFTRFGDMCMVDSDRIETLRLFFYLTFVSVGVG